MLAAALRASSRRARVPSTSTSTSLARALSSASEASDARKPKTNAEIAVLAVGFAGLALGAYTADDALRARGGEARARDPAADACARDDANARGRRLRRWAETHGATFARSDVRDGGAREGAGAFHRENDGESIAPRGLRLRKRERALMTIPDAAVVNWNTAAAHPTLGSTFESLLRRGVVDERLAVMCFFMIERRRGEESAWKEYIDSLPRAYDAPLSFSDEELERELSGTTVYAPVKAQKAHVKKMFEECVRPAMRELTQADNAAGSSLHMLPDVSEKEFAWAFQTFWSRALAIPVGAGGSVTVDSVVPGVDMVNHAPRARANARWEHVEDSSRPDGGYVALVSAPPNRTMKDGEEIFINYGDKSNEELLFTYGFALKDNAVEERMVFFPPWAGDAEHSEDVTRRIELLRAKGLPQHVVLPTTPPKRGFRDMDATVQETLRIWCADVKDLDSRRRVDDATRRKIHNVLRASIGAQSHALRDVEREVDHSIASAREIACDVYRRDIRRLYDNYIEAAARWES
jgi:hypothetical protein|tara:strand:+ start:11532 stop:13100 length:1569 start_codon:yes stop_codon:yes gene_type:complete